MHLTEEQAYPELPDYQRRAGQTFEIGDAVRVGPGYQMGGTYAADGTEGDWFVVGACGPDYKIARLPWDNYKWIVTPARLVPRQVRCLACGESFRGSVDGLCSRDCRRHADREPEDDGWGEAPTPYDGY